MTYLMRQCNLESATYRICDESSFAACFRLQQAGKHRGGQVHCGVLKYMREKKQNSTSGKKLASACWRLVARLRELQNQPVWPRLAWFQGERLEYFQRRGQGSHCACWRVTFCLYSNSNHQLQCRFQLSFRSVKFDRGHGLTCVAVLPCATKAAWMMVLKTPVDRLARSILEQFQLKDQLDGWKMLFLWGHRTWMS